MSERERVEREQRLAEIRESVENRPPLNTLAYYGYAIRYFDEIPYLLAEVERLTAERHGERARLESAVVQAALAERRASLALKGRRNGSGPFGAAQAWTAALMALEAAVDALLAFLEKENNVH